MPQAVAQLRVQTQSPEPSVLAAPSREDLRLAALQRYDVLDTPREAAFDGIARITRKAFQVPIALVSMIDGHRQWFKACVGIPPGEAPRDQTICTHTIESDGPLIIADAAADPRFAHSPFVLGPPYVRFYAGVPLCTNDGHNIGTLCAADTRPRSFSAEDLEVLSDLAMLAMNELELRQLASIDTVTGAMSRRAFKDEARRAVSLALRHHHDLGCLVVGLDGFDALNEKLGRAAGDAILRIVAETCRAALRTTDLLGRLGGAQFAAMLPLAGRATIPHIAEKLRAAIEGLRFDQWPETRLTASVGAAFLDRATADLDVLLEHALAALTQAREAGGNKAVAWATAPAPGGSPRRRVLKGGQILFNDRKSTIDCTVRSLSDDGAGIDVYDAVNVPKRFVLAIKADAFERTCRVVERTEKHLDVEFE